MRTRITPNTDNSSARDNFLKFLDMKQSPQKSLWCIPILAVTYNISNNRFVHRCWKISCSKHVGFSILVKKIVPLDFGWVGIWRTESVKGVLLKSFFSFGKEETSRKVFMLRSLYSKFAIFFNKTAADIICVSKNYNGCLRKKPAKWRWEGTFS